MKPRNCLALVVTSVLAIGCASAQAQDGQGNAPAPAPQGPPAADRPRDELPPEVREAVRQGQEKIRAAADRVRQAEEKVEDAQRNGLGAQHPTMVEATVALERAREALDEAKVEQMHRMVEVEAVRQQQDGMRHGPGGPDGRGDDRMRGLGYVGGPRGPGGRRGPGGPGPSVEERLAQIERAVHEMREMFERHGVPPEMRERGEREMRERSGDGRGAGWRIVGPGGEIEPGEFEVVRRDRRPDGPDRPPVPRPPKPDSIPLGKVLGPDGQGVDEARVQLDAARAEMDAHMKEMRDQMEAQMRQAHEQMAALKQHLADTQEALKKAQAEIEELRAKK